METSGITPVMNMGNDNGFGMNGLGGIFALLVLLGLFNGGFGGYGGNNGVNALNADMQRGFDNQNLQAQTRDIMNTSNLNASNVINAVKDGNASIIREFGTVETALASVVGQMQNCCCDIKQQIMQNDYNGAMRDAATNANFTAQIQGVKDMIYQNTIQGLRDQVDCLRDQVNLSGVLRFPTSWTYAGGVFPPVQSGTTA